MYDPRSPNDRLLLGMKGTLSEMELSLLRQRSLEALKLKAARGELHTTVAIGYVRGPGDRIEMDPDLRVREAIGLVFRKFAELHSVRQVLLWLHQEALPLPSLQQGAEGRAVVWKLPVYASVLHILTNPVYAGAYAFGRSESRVRIEGGRKRVVRGQLRSRERWQVLIVDHHPGYIGWDVYEHNQRVIADNANMKGEMVRGALREGEALLAGLLRCGHCGRKLYVTYGGSQGRTSRYHCRGARDRPRVCEQVRLVRGTAHRPGGGRRSTAPAQAAGHRGRAARHRAARHRRRRQAPAPRARLGASALRSHPCPSSV